MTEAHIDKNGGGTVLQAARAYIERGLAPIPIPTGEKNPNRRGWQDERWTLEDAPRLWNNGQNVGLLLGKPSKGLVDVDLDRHEARAVAPFLLPDTHESGRERCPGSHRWYYCDPIPDTADYKLPGKGDDRCIVELRSTGRQTVVWPSKHPDGDRYTRGSGKTVSISGEELAERVQDVATAALLVINYPGQGSRHDYVLAATGYLGRHLGTERTERIMEAAIHASGDEETTSRLADVYSTLEKLGREEAVTGGPTLDNLAPGLPEQLVRWGCIRRGWVKASEATRKEEEEVGITKQLADAILMHDHFAQDAGGKLYRFQGGAYRQFGERYIKMRVKQLLEEWGETKKWSSHRASEVAEYIRVDSPLLWEKPPIDEVNVQNGILNAFTKELRPHSPDFLSTVQLPVTYDPSAGCPEWDKFVGGTFPEDAQRLAYEIPADLMTPERSHQKALLLIGEGANGKSTYLEAVEKFAGSTNVAGLSLHKMESDRFSVSRLVGKLANICPDLPSTHLTETSMFKAMTGGDRVNAEYKYRESFEFAPFARLVFSANQVPRCEDASHAFFRRWLVVPFDRTFDESEQIPREELDARLSNPRELSGVLNKALEVLPDLRENGFTESASMREAWTEFRAMTDPVSVWLDKATIHGAEAFVPKSLLSKAYNDHCDQQGRGGMNAKAFGRALKRVRPNIDDGQRSVNGEKVWCWLGVGLAAPEPDPPGGPSPEGQFDQEASAARKSRKSRNSTNCFLNGVGSDNGDEKEEKGSKTTNKETSVTSVTSVTSKRLTEEESRQAQKLISQGMSSKIAREEVHRSRGEGKGARDA